MSAPARPRVALLNPNTNVATTAAMTSVAQAEAGDAFVLDPVTAPAGPPLIATPEALAAAGDVVAGMADGLRAYAGVIVAAFGDPGRARLAATLEGPVVGIAEAALAEAAALSSGRFAIVTTTSGLKDAMQALAEDYGHGAALAAILTTPGDPAALMADPETLVRALADLIDRATREHGARAVVIGGGPLADAARHLAASSPVPIVQPVPAAVRRLRRRLEEIAP